MLSHADGARKKRRATEVALAAEDERLLASSGALRRRGRPMSLNEALRKGANVDTTRYMYVELVDDHAGDGSRWQDSLYFAVLRAHHPLLVAVMQNTKHPCLIR